MFEMALQELSDGNSRVKAAHGTERSLGCQHMACRDAVYSGEFSEEIFRTDLHLQASVIWHQEKCDALFWWIATH